MTWNRGLWLEPPKTVNFNLVPLLCVYLVLNQHGDVHKHVMELFDAAFQSHDVFVTSFNLIQGLLVDLRVHDLRREGVCCEGQKRRQRKIRSAKE